MAAERSGDSTDLDEADPSQLEDGPVGPIEAVGW